MAEPSPSTDDPLRAGLGLAFLAYASWGLLTLFWKALAGVPTVEQLIWRIVGAALIMLGLLARKRRLAELSAILRDAPRRNRLLLSATLLAVNWFVFLYAVETERVLHASLGYYLNPIVSTVLGMLVLGERLRRLQWAAVCAALTGVGLLVWRAGEFPWIGLALALAFGFYGLLRKTVDVEPLPGSAIETSVLAIPCVALIGWLELHTGTGHFVRAGTATTLLLLATGLITAVPLLWFTAAARKLPLFALGFMQYLTPTTQFLIAVWVFHERFTPAHAVAFATIWTGVALFVLDIVIQRRRIRRVMTPV
jgi:chloramphenicol-sensitive protein RarD